ncbi:hypothetical protein [Streptomyces lavendulocolor]|uniref:hypothetical protein n=1 Tax=Streptomyces lavendulocolor TaxID=67316 RepID=UPI00340CC7D0
MKKPLVGLKGRAATVLAAVPLLMLCSPASAVETPPGDWGWPVGYDAATGIPGLHGASTVDTGGSKDINQVIRLYCNPTPSAVSPSVDNTGCFYNRDMQLQIIGQNDALITTSSHEDDTSRGSNPQHTFSVHLPDGTSKIVGNCFIEDSQRVNCRITVDEAKVPAGAYLYIANMDAFSPTESCTEAFEVRWVSPRHNPQRPPVTTPSTSGNGLNDEGGLSDFYNLISDGICE